jgi:endonuclease I
MQNGMLRGEFMAVVLMSEAELPPAVGASTPTPAPADQSDANLPAALLELEESKTRTYYEAVADRADADRFYAGVRLDQLAALLRQTHNVQPRYQPVKELYPWVDLQPDRLIRSLYTGHSYDPAELIAGDFRIAELRRAERTRLIALGPDMNAAAVEEALERELPYNCEHVVPQSWFEKQEPMRGDLHHLFACESRCASLRGNSPYAEFPDLPDPTEVVRTDCGNTERTGFEPAHGKGPAARAVFYFCLRYPGVISAAELPPDRLDVLLAWHGQAPVSEWERHRNAAIFARQGNRNPFIDHPDWAAAVIPGLRTGMS